MENLEILEFDSNSIDSVCPSARQKSAISASNYGEDARLIVTAVRMNAIVRLWGLCYNTSLPYDQRNK